jgi:Uma2 family endonuclease
MANPQPKPFPFATLEAFLAWERHQETKHELIDGTPVAMAGAIEGPSIIQGNVFAAALNKLRGGPCRPFPSDMAVKTGVNRGRYPDVTIDCGARNAGNQSAPDPRVMFEVLSPETQKQDRTIKLAEYNAVRSIAHYVLIEQSEPLIHVYSRGAGGDFIIRPEETAGLSDVLTLPALGISLSLHEIYDGIDIDVAANPYAPPPTPRPWQS